MSGSRRKQDPAPTPATGPTKRRYLVAAKSFAKYLQEIGVFTINPLRDVKALRPNRPRCSFLELPDVIRLVEASPAPYRAVFALAYGAGLEIGAILSLVDTDVDTDVDIRTREVRARGTKAWTRDRIARVAAGQVLVRVEFLPSRNGCTQRCVRTGEDRVAVHESAMVPSGGRHA